MADVEALYASLEEEIKALEDRYIAKFLPADPSIGPEDYEYDVKAFCLLAHASFEEFIELLSESVMEEIGSDFLNKKITLSTALFILTYGEKLIVAEEEDSQRTCFEYVRATLTSAKQRHSTALKDNHGFSLKYLRSILTPVGLNVPEGFRLDSLKKLADARGSYAHSQAKRALYGDYKRATNPLAPEDAQKIVTDCRDLCSEIKENSKSRW